MKYSPSLFSSFFNNAWTVETKESHLSCSKGGANHQIDYFEIHELRIENGLIWDSLTLKLPDRVLVLEGLPSKMASALLSDLYARIRKRVTDRFLSNKNLSCEAVSESIQQLLEADKYLSKSDVRHWYRDIPQIGEALSHPFFNPSLLPQSFNSVISQLEDLSKPDSPLLKERNEQYVKKSMYTYAHLFGRLEKYPLTEEQMRAAIVDEDRNLLIAAAGSGKSSTIVAKVVFLIERELATPDQILTLTYNKDAQTQLDRRINELKGITPAFNCEISSKTFHSLGMEIIAKVEGKKPDISEIASAGKFRSLKIFGSLIEGLMKKDPGFAANWRTFQAVMKVPLADPDGFKNYKEYLIFLKKSGVEWRQGQGEQRGRIELICMNGLGVKSLEERRIVDWLCMNGIAFEYERPYPADTATETHRRYKPDFYYHGIDLYHEHFGLNSQGKPPGFMGDRYLEEVKWKRNFHREQETNFFETTSADFNDGTLFRKMADMFAIKGLEYSPLSVTEIDAIIERSFETESDIEILLTILKHYKANNAQPGWLKLKAANSNDPMRTSLFIEIFLKIYNEYQKYLGDDIDFEDQIIKACGFLESKQYVHNYKYVLVDETQDLSQDRKRMLNALLDQNGAIKLFAVGDDWQSIYRFAGADIDIMTRFPEHFGATAVSHLTKTFRSYQGIIDVASEFVQRNPAQFRKSIAARADIEGNLVMVREYASDADRGELIDATLARFNALAAEKGVGLTVFLLARYNRQKPQNFQKLVDRFSKLDISFMSVHASKGLEADYVLLLDVNEGMYGFPSKITDDPLLHLVIPRPEAYPDAEERRLFYVALTRAKRAVFIFTRKGSASPFIKEIAELKRVGGAAQFARMNPCPECETGELSMRRGKYNMFMGCSNYPDCKCSTTLYCPRCETGKLVARRSSKGEFVGCNNYPKCRYIHKEDRRNPVMTR